MALRGSRRGDQACLVGMVGMARCALLWCGLPFSKLAQVSMASSDALESVTA